jgi:hypothetical protein
MKGGWRKLYNELGNFSSSPYEYIVRMIKSRRMRWTGHAAHMGAVGNAHGVLIRKSGGKLLFF